LWIGADITVAVVVGNCRWGCWHSVVATSGRSAQVLSARVAITTGDSRIGTNTACSLRHWTDVTVGLGALVNVVASGALAGSVTSAQASAEIASLDGRKRSTHLPDHS